jgi:hypothetical protein
MFSELDWKPIEFVVPAMPVAVKTQNESGKKVKKTDAMGNIVQDHRIIPKERPRMSYRSPKASGGIIDAVRQQYGASSDEFTAFHKGKPIVYTSENTTKFEAWIRKYFFNIYPSNLGIKNKNKYMQVDEIFLGCQRPNETAPCTLFRTNADFKSCKECLYRRKNLALDLEIFVKNDHHLDGDNVVKIVLDALNHVCFYDDGQFILKKAQMFFWAKEEHLKIKIGVVPPFFKQGNLCAGYAFRQLPVEIAKSYVEYLGKNCLMSDQFQDFIDYLDRCDRRAYIKNITLGLLKKKTEVK